MDWILSKTFWLDIAGVRLEVRCWGPPPQEAPTAVLLHEGLGSVSLWRDFPEKLAKVSGCGVFAFSRQGYGQSDPVDLPRPIDYMQREAKEVLPLVLKDIGVQKYVLLGHSDGASIAAVYGGHFDDPHLNGLVLFAPHFFTEADGLASIAEAKTTFENTDLKTRMARHHKDPENAFRGWNDAWLNPEFKAWDICKYISDIKVPVLAVQGEDDQYGTMAQLDVLEARLPTPLNRLELEGCQHQPHFNRPNSTLKAVVAFLNEQITAL